ncbi:hypothetical protein NE237_012908 [Protea cynaroides]|uniref:HMA domain-containing protein n=1 Tax=Protea cynaroides TaxID=273540 RepID=A0A9Q0H104_9MAGN|nr:hypothetical protein NE237_012908 [Protea cynaroides]
MKWPFENQQINHLSQGSCFMRKAAEGAVYGWEQWNHQILEFQVIVMKANLSCRHCRSRVSQVVSKMKGLVEYEFDVRNKEVIVKGGMESSTIPLLSFPTKTNKRSVDVESSEPLSINVQRKYEPIKVVRRSSSRLLSSPLFIPLAATVRYVMKASHSRARAAHHSFWQSSIDRLLQWRTLHRLCVYGFEAQTNERPNTSPYALQFQSGNLKHKDGLYH